MEISDTFIIPYRRASLSNKLDLADWIEAAEFLYGN